jgi:hypothetical protein
VDLSGCQMNAGRIAQSIDGGVNFRAQSAFAASDRLVFAYVFADFFFAPALC